MIDTQYEPLFAGMLADAMSGKIPDLPPVTPERLAELGILKDTIEGRQTQVMPIDGKPVNAATRMRAVAAARTPRPPGNYTVEQVGIIMPNGADFPTGPDDLIGATVVLRYKDNPNA